ncbi:MAG TPA: hypothetical protein VI729_06980 [Anaerolineales bacterium]|nr:hypothetical protein [Anaerolineales bacterium]
MRQAISLRQTVWIVLGLAVVQFVLQLSLLARGVEYVASSLTIDDTYYYLQTAWNTKQLGFVTFDGVHATNGVQLLWFVIILALAILVETKTALLFATLTVTFLLNSLCYLFILSIAAILRRPSLALVMAGLWFLQSLPFRVYSMGMENSLHAMVIWCLVWQSTAFVIQVRQGRTPKFWGLTVALILVVWTRLDSALLSGIVFGFCMAVLVYSYRHDIRLFLQRYTQVVVRSGLVASCGVITQLIAFRLMGDSALPVSAIVKTAGAEGGLGAEAAERLVNVMVLGMPPILQGRLPTLALVGLGVMAVMLVARAFVGAPHQAIELSAFLYLWACLLVGELLYQAYVAVSGVEYRPYFSWYRSPSFIFWTVTASLVALFALERIRPVKRLSPFVPWAPLGLGLLTVAVAVYLFAGSIGFTSKLYAARYDAALWIASNSPPDTTFAAWNAGQLGYFSDRAFINLDGVINNVDYYERVLRGPVPLVDYLAENKVDYVVDYSTYDSIPDFPVVQAFPIDDGSGRAIQVWQVPSR